ncbi:MAG: RHS repeat-associated core domain-containing protein [Patescibacteria group bacterium]
MRYIPRIFSALLALISLTTPVFVGAQENPEPAEIPVYLFIAENGNVWIVSPIIFDAEGNTIATVETVGSTASTYSNHPDHLTGSNVVTNEAGNLEQVIDYYPFGGIRLNDQNSSFDEQRKFTGQEYDKDTNLHYYGQRYYNQDVGRFLSQDPVHLLIGDSQRFKEKAERSLEFHLSNPQSLNSYSYTINNPLKYVDETGEIWQYIAALFWPDVAHAPTIGEDTSNDPVETTLFIGSFAPIGGGGVKTVSSAAKNLADDAVRTADEVKTLYHGSVNNFGDIMKEGFSSKRHLFLTEDVSDAIKYSQKFANPRDSGVIRIDVPLKFFKETIEPLRDIFVKPTDFKIQDRGTIEKINEFIDKF